MTRTQGTKLSATRSEKNYISEAGPGEGLFVALELGLAQWKLAFATRPGQKPRRRTIAGRDVAALADEVTKAKERFELPAEAPVYSCYEAGRDAFWLHRALSDQGIVNVVVDSASIEVNRRARRTKNDKLDAGKLLSMLMRYHGGETGLWSVVRVPGRKDEDVRQRQRELGALGDERNRHLNRIHALLMQQGVRVTIDQTLGERLNTLRDANGEALPKHLCERIRRELDRLALVDEQMAEIEQQRRKHQKKQDDAQAKQVRQLCALRGIGPESAWLLTGELFSWRQIQNRKELAALAGLTPSSYASGEIEHDQGISKAGNKRVRWMMTEIAWSWLNHQPDSELSQWFKRRFGNASKRQRRIGIVALARKLLVRLWQYLETGVVPEGAVFSARSP
jgi:transposase